MNLLQLPAGVILAARLEATLDLAGLVLSPSRSCLRRELGALPP